MTIYNVRDYALPDAEPKRGGGGRTALVGVVALDVGLALGVGLGVGLGADFALVGAFGTKRVLAAITAMSSGGVSARDRWRCNSVSEYDYPVPGPEELEWMLARRQGRYAEPHWPAP